MDALDIRIAEAKVRLAERKESLQQPGGLDFLGKLNSQQAELMIDLTGLQAQADYVQRRYPRLAAERERLTKRLRELDIILAAPYKAIGATGPTFQPEE